MNRIFAVSAVVLCLFACKKVQEESPYFEGRVLDANMSMIVLQTAPDDTLVLRIYDVDELPGVFVGDSISAYCDKVIPADGSENYYIVRKIDFIKADSAHLIDTWTETVEGQLEVQGFTLNDDGTANSVGMSAIRIRNWSIDEDGNLVLKMNIRGSTTQPVKYVKYRIAKLDADSLILEDISSGEKDWIMSNKYDWE